MTFLMLRWEPQNNYIIAGSTVRFCGSFFNQRCVNGDPLHSVKFQIRGRIFKKLLLAVNNGMEINLYRKYVDDKIWNRIGPWVKSLTNILVRGWFTKWAIISNFIKRKWTWNCFWRRNRILLASGIDAKNGTKAKFKIAPHMEDCRLHAPL